MRDKSKWPTINENLTFVADEGHSRMLTKMRAFFRAAIQLSGSLTIGPTNTSRPPLSGEVKFHVIG